MPTYEYKREDGSTFEITQKMSDTTLKICPTTGQSVKRIISGGGGVVYKGEGWYVTDYKNGGKQHTKNSDSQKENAKPETKKEASKESRVEKKS